MSIFDMLPKVAVGALALVGAVTITAGGIAWAAWQQFGGRAA